MDGSIPLDKKYIPHYHERMSNEERELQNAVSEGALGSQPPAVRRQKPPDFAGIRRRYQNAYKAWTSEEDSQLKQSLACGLGVAAIAHLHGRPVSAIRSRI